VLAAEVARSAETALRAEAAPPAAVGLAVDLVAGLVAAAEEVSPGQRSEQETSSDRAPGRGAHTPASACHSTD
jgi:hypothetical protein